MNQRSPDTASRRWRSETARSAAFFVVAAGAAFVFRFVILTHLTNNVVADDERVQGVLATHVLDGLLMPLGSYMVDYYAGGTVVTGVAAAPFFHFLGPTVLALRMPSVILGTLGLACLALAFRLAVSRLAGWLAALALLVLPPWPLKLSVVAFGNHAELASLLGIWMLAFYHALLNDKGGLRPVPTAAFGMITGFCCFFDLLTWAFLPIVVGGLILSRPGRLRVWRCLLFLAGALIGFLPRFLLSSGGSVKTLLVGTLRHPPGATQVLRGNSPARLQLFFSETVLPSLGFSSAVGTAMVLFLLACLAVVTALLVWRVWREPDKPGAFNAVKFDTAVLLAAASFPVLVFLARADSPPRYLLPAWPFLLTVPVLLARYSRWLLPLALVFPLVASADLASHLSREAVPEVRQEGFLYRYFWFDYGRPPLQARHELLAPLWEEADECDRELMQRAFVIASAREQGRDVSRHIRRLATDARRSDPAAEAALSRALDDFNRYLKLKVENTERIHDASEILRPLLDCCAAVADHHRHCRQRRLGLGE